MVGTNAVASEVGLGAEAGASAAVTFWIVDVAINIITMAKKSFILNASIYSKLALAKIFLERERMCMCGGKKMLQSNKKSWCKGNGVEGLGPSKGFYRCGRRERKLGLQVGCP